MNNMRNEQTIIKIKNIINIGIWAAFFCFLILQYRKVFLYYDDYGYMSMSYGWTPADWVFGNRLLFIFRYMYHSYFQVNGRLYTNFLLILSANLGGLSFMRLVMPVGILLTYYLGYRLITAGDFKGEKWLVSLFLMISYGAIPLSVANSGLYWFAAAYGYVIPIFNFLLLVSIYRSKKYTVLKYILVFVLCISSEQAVVMTGSWIVCNLIYDYWKEHKFNQADGLLLADAVFSTLILVGSPASRSRMTGSNDYTRGFVERTIDYIKRTIFQMFSLDVTIQLLILFTLVLLCVLLFQKTKKKCALAGIGYVALACAGYWMRTQGRISDTPFGILWGGVYLLLFVYGFWYFMIRDHRMAFVLVSMYSAVGIMFLMPEAPMRIYIPFLFLLTMVCGYLYVQVAGKMERLLVFSALVLFSLNAVGNAKMIYQGYCENAKILTINHSKLLEAADQIAAGVEVKAVDLYRVKDSQYSGQQPYSNGLSYMLFWYDNYYNLPYKTQYNYGEYPTGEGKIEIKIVE